MLTLTMDEITRILGQHFTPEEIIDVLQIESYELVECLRDVIEEKYDRVVQTITEEIGDVFDEG